MPNFLAAAWLDVHDLAASLRTKMGLFEVLDTDDTMGLSVFSVRGYRDDSASEEKTGRFVLRSRASKWIELTNAMQRILRLGEQMGGIEYGEIDLCLLPAGGCMAWQREPHYRGDSVEYYEHAILPLRTSPHVTLFAGPEVWIPAIVGQLIIVNRRVPRSALNMGEGPAIWLAMDFRRKEPDAR